MARRVVHHASGTSDYARCGARLGERSAWVPGSVGVTCGRCRKVLFLPPVGCGCTKHTLPEECKAGCRCACNADFVRVERWECRVGCGALLRLEEVEGHGCQQPNTPGTDADPVCANCGELRSAHASSDFEKLPPYCRSTPFHLIHFRAEATP